LEDRITVLALVSGKYMTQMEYISEVQAQSMARDIGGG